MKVVLASLALIFLAACGVETAGTAATAAAVKKQEIEQGKKTLEQAQQKIDASVKLEQQSASQGEEK